jgi:GAF domain-containing protein
MTKLQPAGTRDQSLLQQARQFWLRLITPHPSIKAIEEYRRAQLLAILTLLLGSLFIIAIISRPRSLGVFLILGLITLASYALSRTEYYRIGTYLFTYAFTAIGYIRIFDGTANSIEISITSTVHISLIFASALLSQRGFLSLATLSTLATFLAPLYSKAPVTEFESTYRTAGVVLVIGAILYGVQLFRASLEKERLKELTNTNRELENLTAELDQRIKTRTVELEVANRQAQERAARFQIISEISQEISSNVDLPPRELLNRITQLISEKLGFYHVGIFLIDENREFAVLRAANSEGGKHMLERRHQLKVGGTGIVGYVSQGGRPRIALDTGTDAVFFNNPDLPKTRSEIALPMKYGAAIIGVLDVQSTLASAFRDEDANLLSTLANQIAIVINSVLVGERNTYHGKAVAQRIGLNLRQNQKGYSYNPDGTISIAAAINNPATKEIIATSETVVTSRGSAEFPPTLSVPVKFRDQLIGIIQIESTDINRKWTDDEVSMVQSISDRAAFALENARLFEETSRRADQEETIAKITSQIGASTDFDQIMQSTIQELGRALGTTRSFIQLNSSSSNEQAS